MMPEDTKARKADTEERLWQLKVNDHFPILEPVPQERRPKPYMDKSFEEAAIEWLIRTDQVRSESIFTFLIDLINVIADSSI
jgi:hypothetical protein